MLRSAIIVSESTHQHRVWLESKSGEQFAIEGNTSIGRAPGNMLVLNEEKVSRRHATINPQTNGEFLFIDLGSSNGSYINGRRLHQPHLLNDGDRIEIGSNVFTFRHPNRRPTTELRDGEAEKTLHDVRPMNCWLLVADLEGSTELVRRLSQEEATNRTTLWLAECRAIVERHQGVMNKFLGDGFLAYWREAPAAAAMVADALEIFLVRQKEGSPRFRLALHFGRVFVGGAASLGEESLLGSEVNFVFRMEKVAASSGCLCLVSGPAREKLRPQVDLEEFCRRPVAGFEGEFEFYAPPP